MTKPVLRAVGAATEVNLPDDFAADLVALSLRPDAKLNKMDDVHRKEAAFCAQEIANTERALKLEIERIENEVNRLVSQMQSKRDAAKAEIDILNIRKAKAEAYLGAGKAGA